MGEAKRRKKLDPNFGKERKNFLFQIVKDDEIEFDPILVQMYDQVDEKICSADLGEVVLENETCQYLIVFHSDKTELGCEILMLKPSFVSDILRKSDRDFLLDLKQKAIMMFFKKFDLPFPTSFVLPKKMNVSYVGKYINF